MTLLNITGLVQSYGYLALFLLIALESIGIPLPGETALITAALYAGSTGNLNVAAVAAIAATAAVLGDNGGYWLGAVGGQRLVARHGHRLHLDPAKLKVGRYLYERHGVPVVLLGRFVAVLRTYAAFFAGLNRMPWSRFLAANAVGGVLWAGIYTFGAYGLGAAATSVGSTVTIVGSVVTVVLTIVIVLAARRSMGELQRRAEAAYPELADVAKPEFDSVASRNGR